MFEKILSTLNNSNYFIKRLAGHSKWANIKHTKGLKDAQKSKMFTKIGQHVKVAIQEGGSPNPAFNLKLQQVIAQARRMSMPLASIESIIKSTQKDATQCKSHVLEIKGPGNCIILCEVFTPNLVKTKNNISAIMKKHASKYLESGVKHLFEHKGLIDTESPATTPAVSTEAILETATNHAIECEAEDVTLLEDSNLLQFVCDPFNFGKVQKKLEELSYKIVNANLEYVPQMMTSLSDADLEMCSKLFDKLEALDDVVRLHDNIA